MPIRNPFARRPGPAAVQDENQRPGSAAGTPDAAHPGFERVDTVGSKASSAFSVRSRRSQDTGEYKLSVVNDSGVYLPPSPIEKEAPWPRRYLSRTSTTSDRSSVVSAGGALGTGGSGSGEIEHFSISRESFDSYRRSFDISAKSPVFMATDAAAPGRQSLDSHLFSPPTPRFPRSSLGDHPRSPPMMMRRHWDRPREQSLRSEQEEGQVDEEEGTFEEVGLHNDGASAGDSGRQAQSQPHPAPRRRGFFAKFASDSSVGSPEAAASSPSSASPPPAAATPTEEPGMMARFLPLTGRKRAPSSSVQGAELRAMPVAGLDAPERVETPVAGLQASEA